MEELKISVQLKSSRRPVRRADLLFVVGPERVMMDPFLEEIVAIDAQDPEILGTLHRDAGGPVSPL